MGELRARRRLAAVLAADVVGYSRLMEADEAGTLARLKAIRAEAFDPKLAEFRGHVVKTIGDGLLIEFPSVVDAVQCAVEVQQAIAWHEADSPVDKRIAFRLGVNLGDLIIEDGDIFGDGVIIAARLQTLAEPGAVCISRSVFDQIKNKVERRFEDLGAQKVKNIAEPAHVYRIAAGEGQAAREVDGFGAPLPGFAERMVEGLKKAGLPE